MRARATLGAVGIVAIALVIGAIAFLAILGSSLREASVRAAESRAEQIAARVEFDGPGAVRDIDDEVVQLVRGDEVVAASDDAPDVALPSFDAPQLVTVGGEPLLVASEELDDGTAVRLGLAVEDDAETIATVGSLLLVAVPLLVLLVGATTWLIVGRALRPVARIRSEVDDISAERLDRRVPVPESGDEIAALAETMNRMLDRLDAAAQAQRRFISDASHELRSPLATIRQHAELSQAHPEVTSLNELASVVHDEGLRLQGLVDSLLLLARLDEGAPAHQEAVDLDDLALAEVSRLRASGIEVFGTEIGAAQVTGDARLLGQLVRNLADNAARHARSRVAFGVSTVGERAVLTVEDDGVGVPLEERERVFERFVRLDEARSRDAGGSGLGLPIVRAIAAASGGSVVVDESPLGGARFTVTIPVAT